MRKESSRLMIYISLDRPTGNFWIDTGIVILARQFGEGHHPADQIRSWLLSRLVQPSGNVGTYYDIATGQFRQYEKVNWLYPTNLFIKVSGSARKIKIDGRDYFTEPPKFELNLKPSKKPGICDLCGDEAPLVDATMWMYPFVVDPHKFGTFYPSAKRGLRLCVRCALAGLAGYLGWLWKAQGSDALHFFVFHSDLYTMKRLHEEVLDAFRTEGGRGGNAPMALSGPLYYVHETTWGLLLELFAHVRESDRLPVSARRLLASLLGATEADQPPVPISLYAVTGKPGKAFNMHVLREFSKLQQLYRLYEGWLQTLSKAKIRNPHRQLARIFDQFRTRQGQKEETIWRDHVAWAIMESGDPSPPIERFLYEARLKEKNPKPLLPGTLQVLNQYLQEVLSMDEQFQRMLAGFGHSLGSAAHAHNEMGLLYALRNAKNPEDFYRVLNDAQFRLELTIPEALLRVEKGERIAGVPWVRVKTLLSIYAMNAYLRKGVKQEEAQPEQEEAS